jgi:rubrerythrin
MEQNKTLEILKQAILLEKRGKVFYASAADSSKDPDVKEIFRMMASEEDQHIKFLSDQYLFYRDNGRFDDVLPQESGASGNADEAFAHVVASGISAVSYEATAISLAIDMETRAIAAYSRQAEEATDAGEKAFYHWLAEWERGHYDILYRLDQDLRDRIWADNNFWPS